MQKKTLYLKTKYMIIDNMDATADMIYRVEKTVPVKKTIKLKNTNFNDPANREIILKELGLEKIIITQLKPKTHNGRKLLAGVGTKVLVVKKYKTEKYAKKKEQGYSFLEVTIVAALIATLGAFSLPSLISLSQKIEETHYSVVENENSNMNVYNELLGGE